MEKPHPVLGQVPDSQPPPYSTLLGSQSQAYTPVTLPPTSPPYPTQIPTTQGMTVDPMSQVAMDDGRPFPQPGSNVPTVYDPMADLSTFSESTPNQALIVSAQSANSGRKAKRCCCLKIGSTISTILVVLGIGARILKQLYDSNELNTPKISVENIYRGDTHQNWQPNDYDVLRRKLADSIIHHKDPNWQYNNRYRRMAGAQEIDDFKDHDLADFNDQSLLDKSFNHQKFSQQRRDLKMKKKFDKSRMKFSTKKKYYKAKKFIK